MERAGLKEAMQKYTNTLVAYFFPQTADKIGDENTHNEIISSIDELEKTQGQGGWTHAYERFVGLLADHITLFALFLPKLMHIATGLL